MTTMNDKEKIKWFKCNISEARFIAYEICNTIGCCDNYPAIYQAAYEIQHRGKPTKKTYKSISKLQSSDPLKLNYVPEELLGKLKSIIE